MDSLNCTYFHIFAHFVSGLVSGDYEVLGDFLFALMCLNYKSQFLHSRTHVYKRHSTLENIYNFLQNITFDKKSKVNNTRTFHFFLLICRRKKKLYTAAASDREILQNIWQNFVQFAFWCCYDLLWFFFYYKKNLK